MNWINVEDSLPDDDVEVLIYVDGYGQSVGSNYTDESGGTWRIGSSCLPWDNDYNLDVLVTHWMALPEPPK